MTLGPLEYLVAGFEGNRFTGQILAELGPLAGDLVGLFSQEDIEQVIEQFAADLPNRSAAGLLLFEQTWAIGLKEAIKSAGGIAVTGGFVVPDVLQVLEQDLVAAKQSV